MKLTICIISTIVLALLISPVFAYSSLNGATGTANLPNAEIAKGGGQLTFDTQNVQGIAPAPLGGTYTVQDVPFETTTINAQIWRGVYGFSKKLELSGDYVATSRNTRGLSAKYMINETENSKNAIGFVYGTTSALSLPLLGFSTKGEGTTPPFPGPVGVPSGMEMMLSRINTVQGYFAHTRTLMAEGHKRPAIMGTIGANFTDMTFRDGVAREFASVEFSYLKNSVAVDYQTRNTTIESKPMWSLVGRREFQSGLGVEFGWTNSMGMLGGSASRFFFGGSLAYGK